MIDFEKEFNDSYSRIFGGKTSAGNEFLDDFYERFIAASPRVAEKFTNVDMDGQKRMLKQSLLYLVNLYSMRVVPGHLVEIATKHDREHADISPDLYQLWLECLIATVQARDPKFNDQVELAWRLICSQGITFMTFVHSKSKTPVQANGSR